MIYQESKGLLRLNSPSNLEVKDLMEIFRGGFYLSFAHCVFALHVKQNQAKLV